MSRSRLFSEALREYVVRHAPEEVTEAMDRAYAELGGRRGGRVYGGGGVPDPGAQRVVISQGEVWWSDLSAPTGSSPGFRRPVVVVQGDGLNRIRIGTVVCVPLTSNLKWAAAPGNVILSSCLTGLAKESVANVSQLVTVDKAQLTERVGNFRLQSWR